MAMTAQVKAELSSTQVTKTCCRKAEVSTLLRFAGGLAGCGSPGNWQTAVRRGNWQAAVRRGNWQARFAGSPVPGRDRRYAARRHLTARAGPVADRFIGSPPSRRAGAAAEFAE